MKISMSRDIFEKKTNYKNSKNKKFKNKFN